MALFIKGQVAWNKKKHIKKFCLVCSEHFEVKQSLDRIKYCSHSCAAKATRNRKGTKTSIETKKKQRLAKLGIRGEKHWNWKDGGVKRNQRHLDMGRDEYIQWRKAVFLRDNFTCQECGDCKKYLNADHIKPYSLFSDLRYSISNGRTLCIDCHKKTPTFGGRIKKYVEVIRG